VDVLQLLHGLLAHVLQLADVVVHVRDLHLAGRPRPPRRDLPQEKRCSVRAGRRPSLAACSRHTRDRWDLVVRDH
jgi:hypothetical protein